MDSRFKAIKKNLNQQIMAPHALSRSLVQNFFPSIWTEICNLAVDFGLSLSSTGGRQTECWISNPHHRSAMELFMYPL
ncbi:MAG: hypothetical protein D6785_07565 [Planctomycetota bacterium]|nr:MAG: hypothetical protein D6785_07565 [Planctomycetota bacterium]